MIGKKYMGLLDYANGVDSFRGVHSSGVLHFGHLDDKAVDLLEWMGPHDSPLTLESIATGMEVPEDLVIPHLETLKHEGMLEQTEDGYRVRDHVRHRITEHDGAHRRHLLGSMLIGAFSFSRYRILDFLLVITAQVMIARWAGFKNFGDVVVVGLIATIIGIAATGGLCNILTVFLPEYEHSDDRNRFLGLFRYVMTRVVLSSIIVTSLCIGVTLLLPLSDQTKFLMALAFCKIPLWNIWDVAQLVSASVKQWTRAYIVEYIIQPLALIGLLVTAHFMLEQITAEQVIVIKLVTAAIAMSLQLLIASHFISRYCKGATPEYDAREWNAKARPLLFNTLVAILRGSVPLLTLQAFVGGVVPGMFAAARSAVMPVGIVRAAFKNSGTPDISWLFERGFNERLSYLCRTMTGANAIVTLMIVPPIAIFGHQILALYGNDSDATYGLLLLLLCGSVILSLFGYPTAFLRNTEFQKNAVIVSLISLFTMLALVWIFVIPNRHDPTAALIGCGFAIMTNAVVIQSGAWFFMIRDIGFTSFVTGTFIPLRYRYLERFFRRSVETGAVVEAVSR